MELSPDPKYSIKVGSLPLDSSRTLMLLHTLRRSPEPGTNLTPELKSQIVNLPFNKLEKVSPGHPSYS